MAPNVAEVTRFLDSLYPPESAEPWDAVGLTVGEDHAAVTSILFAVDIDPIVIAEAVELKVDMIITHHPLFLSGTTTVAARTPKGRMVHDLITNNVALYSAHTNADIAPSGVNEALADLLGIQEASPLVDSKALTAHPGSGIGRVGRLEEPTTLDGFAAQVAAALPSTYHGLRVLGDGDRVVESVAVCGGSGDSYLKAAHEAGVDVYLTADLRHHRASEFSHESGAPALIDVAHYASEWPWLPVISQRVGSRFNIDVHVSTLNTDPWTNRLKSTNEGVFQ